MLMNDKTSDRRVAFIFGYGLVKAYCCKGLGPGILVRIRSANPLVLLPFALSHSKNRLALVDLPSSLQI